MFRVRVVACNRNGFWYYVTRRLAKCGPRVACHCSTSALRPEVWFQQHETKICEFRWL